MLLKLFYNFAYKSQLTQLNIHKRNRMKFSEFNYERPNMDTLQKSFDTLVAQFKVAQNVEEQNAVIDEINKLREHFETMSNIAYIRYSIDTANKAYEAEQSFFDKNSPIYSGMELSLIHI